MNWDELDSGKPVVGDPGAVNRVAAELHQVGLDAEQLLHRLGNLQAGTGDAVWRGPAADAFRRLLDQSRPDLTKLATSHDTADGALRRYALRLADAEDDAGRALRDGGAAKADRDTAARDRDAYAGQAGSAGRTAAEADLAVTGVAVRRLLSPDPAYQAELSRYEAAERARRDTARQQESTARAGQATEQRNVDDATGRLAAAKRLAHQAASLRDDAAREAARTLDDAGRAAVDRRSVWRKLWDGAGAELKSLDKTLRDMTGSPAFMSWMNILGDVGGILAGVGQLMMIVPIPIVAGIGAALLGTGLAFSGLAFLGTLLAARYGNASGGQVLEKGVGFVLAAIPAKAGLGSKLLAKGGAGVLKSGKALSKAGSPKVLKAAGGLLRRAGTTLRPVVRNLEHEDPKTWRQTFGLERKLWKAAGIRPSQYFAVLDKSGKFLEEKAVPALSATKSGVELYKDIRGFGDPETKGLPADDLVPRLAGVVGKATGLPVVGDVVEGVVEAGMKGKGAVDAARK